MGCELRTDTFRIQKGFIGYLLSVKKSPVRVLDIVYRTYVFCQVQSPVFPKIDKMSDFITGNHVSSVQYPEPAIDKFKTVL